MCESFQGCLIIYLNVVILNIEFNRSYYTFLWRNAKYGVLFWSHRRKYSCHRCWLDAGVSASSLDQHPSSVSTARVVWIRYASRTVVCFLAQLAFRHALSLLLFTTIFLCFKVLKKERKKRKRVISRGLRCVECRRGRRKWFVETFSARTFTVLDVGYNLFNFIIFFGRVCMWILIRDNGRLRVPRQAEFISCKYPVKWIIRTWTCASEAGVYIT